MVQARLAQTKKDRADKEDRDSDRDCAGHRRDGRVREIAQQERTNDELAGHVCEHDMMDQFWLYTLADGRRVLVEANIRLDRFDLMIGFGVVRAILRA